MNDQRTLPDVTRRGFLATAAGSAAFASLPAWPARAEDADGSGAPVIHPHPATEPSGTHARDIGGTNVLFAYGAVVPSFDGWRTQEPERRYLSLDGDWRFAFDPEAAGEDRGWHEEDFDDRAWSRIAVPSSWDLYDTPGFGTLDGADFGEGTAFTDGYAWYRREIRLNGPWNRRHLRLNFLAVGYTADVWLDGIHLGQHDGASAAFSLPLPEMRRVSGPHTVAVRVFRRASYTAYVGANEPVTDDREVPWKPVDYWPYAGIVRSVWLEGVSSTSISKVLVGLVEDRLAVRAVVENHGGRDFTGSVRFDPGDASGLSSTQAEVTVPARSVVVATLDLDDVSGAPRWSPETPQVLTGEASLWTAADTPTRLDSLATDYGVRDLRVEGTALTLDGTPLLLKGLNWHEETATSGRSMTLSEYDTELGHVTALGANLIRNSVYTRHPYVYQWADRNGVTVMDDIDTMWMNTAQERLQTEEYGLCRAMALTMAWNQHNHPSVILWGLQNESEIDAGEAPVYRSWLADMKAATQTVDLTRRPVTWASSTTFDPAFDLADVIGVNEYFGYFYGDSADLGPALDALHAAHPDKPILITENGTWSLVGTPGDGQGTEQWQADYIAEHWEQVVDRASFMAGYTLWVLKDYKERLNYNQEYNGVSVLGLLTFDTEAEKLAYARFRDL